MRILLANKFYYARGGDCICTINLEELLKKNGHEVAIFAMDFPENLQTSWSKYFPGEIRFKPGIGIIEAFARPFGIGEVKRKFNALLDDFHPDVVHVHNIHSQLSPIIVELAHQRGIKVVWTLHDYKLLCPRYDCLRNGTEVCEVPYSKRIVTIEQGCREFDLTAVDEEGNVLNNVVHLVTRFSDDPRQNIDMVKLLETTLTINPDCIAVAEMKGGESMQAINAANTGHSVITTIHANSCEDTYYRMVTLCKQEQPGMDDTTLQNLATKAFPIVAFAKRLEDNSRRIMEITECETLQDGRKKMRTLYRFNITDNIIVEGKPKIIGHYEKVENLSEDLQKRLRENGLPLKMQEQLLAKR